MAALVLPTQRPAPSVLKHFLTLEDAGPGGLRELMDLSTELKRNPAAYRDRLHGGRLGLIFHKPSTRTRVSFESAAWLLGMLPSVMRADELQLGRGETIADTARTLSLYLDTVAIRTFAHSTVADLAAAASIPIINALTDEHHPCQALADVLTLEEELGSVSGARMAFIGDGDNVCTSLIQAASLAGFELRVATPPGYEPPLEVVEAARAISEQTGGRIILTHDPREAAAGADAVYSDVWTSMGKEGEQLARTRAFTGYTVDAALMRLATSDAIYMHCLPAHRGEEVTNEVIDGPQSRVWGQAANRMHTEAALLLWLLGAAGR
jgi:ornithine carbamoyltransferase